jgi:quaternary ammonium compound-resistance protein SugE
MSSAWTFLILAGLLEIGWPVGLKLAQQPGKAVWGIPLAVIFMAASGAFLFFAQKQIPMGTAYAVWTGIGAAGTFLVGVAFQGDSLGVLRIMGVTLIVAGVAALKLSE